MLLMPLLLSALALQTSADVLFKTNDASIRIGGDGMMRSIADAAGREYSVVAKPSPVLSIRIKGEILAPDGMTWDATTGTMRLQYRSAGVVAKLRVLNKHTHLTFELVDLRPKKDVELVLWGPYQTTIGKIVGETVGVVRDDRFALGIQALNIKTLGGYPNTEDDVMASYSHVDTTGPVPVTDSYRGDTAKPTDDGSTLQAYTRDRSKARVIENWGHKFYVAPPFNDGGVVGSKIALFGCPAPQALNRIGEIEVAEGLPHPIMDGVWGKLDKRASASYLIVGFGEKDLADAIELTKKAGLHYLYTDSCFDTWGHFRLDPKMFPDGWPGLKRCVEEAAAQGIRLGVHTLSNFITTNDPYVTPVPDKRLAVVGESVLSADVDSVVTTIPIADPTYFNQMANNNLRTVRAGRELIQYTSVSAEAPWQLLGCKRGAFDTKTYPHRKGETIGKLMDHGYGVFLTNAQLSIEVAKNIARLFNETGLRQLSFDGLEGNWLTGMGQYARTLFTKTWYDTLSPAIKGRVINDASNPGHFFWHIYTRMNWGEPWYAGFRESQTEYRFMNQRYFSRNLMPHMLGWFNMTPEISLEDAEWLMAKSAGYDAGFCLVTSPEGVKQNGDGGAILAAIREWEKARFAGAFSEDQKAILRDNRREFRLKPVDADSWDLTEVASTKAHLPVSGSTDVALDNPFASQPLELIVQVTKDTEIEDLKVALDGATSVRIPGAVRTGGIRYQGGANATLVDANWRRIGTVPVAGGLPSVSKGKHNIAVSAKFSGPKPGEVKLEFRLFGPVQRVTAQPR